MPCKLLFSAPSLLESNKMKRLVQSAMEKSHLEPKSESTNGQLMSTNVAVTTEPLMDCSSAATKGDDHVAVDDIICSPPKNKCKAFDEEGILMGNELTYVYQDQLGTTALQSTV